MPMFKSPSYLCKRPSGWYCCINVPADVRGIVKQSQIRHPLGTRFVSLAKLRAAYGSARFKSLARAKANGKRLGQPKVDPEVEEAIHQALSRRNKGMRKVAREMGVGVSLVQRIRLEVPAIHTPAVGRKLSADL